MTSTANNIKSSYLSNLPNRADVLTALQQHGWVLLRGYDYDVTAFSELMNDLCQTLTYDPARQHVSKETQKVDAGTQAVGLHIENGNTPLPPDIIAFFSELSARKGSQTTVCDGYAVYNALPDDLKTLFEQPITITRTLPKTIWQRYVATAMTNAGTPIDDEAVTMSHLHAFIEQTKQAGISHHVDMQDDPQPDESIRYALTVPAIRSDNLSGLPAFANTILGPSFNYETPVFTFSGGRMIDEEVIETLKTLCEKHTIEVAWQDGDVVVLDNKRMMHGRRQIDVPLDERKLYIGMGLGVRPLSD